MRKFSTNVLLNYVGTGSTAIVYVVLVPIYIHTIGVKTYGILSLLMSLELTLRFLDFGLTLGITREVAMNALNRGRLSSVLGLGIICYGAIALISWGVLCVLGLFSSGLWPELQKVNIANPLSLFVLYGVIIAARWLIAYLYAVLRGFEDHNLVNTSMIVGNVTRVALTAGVLFLIRAELMLALSALVLATLVEISTAVFFYAAELKRRGIILAFSEWKLLREIMSFSGYVTITAAAGGVLKNLDKFLLSSLVSFSALGAYQAAWVAAQMIAALVNPIALASYPRFSRLLAPEDEPDLSRVYHASTSITGLITAPVALGGAVFSHDLLLLVSGSHAVADSAAAAMSLLFLACLPNAVMQISYLLQVASGRPWIAAAYNSGSLVLLFPVYYFGIREFGITGAAMGWLVFNIIYFAVMPRITHHFLLKDEMWRWVFRTCSAPAILASISFLPAALVMYFFHTSTIFDVLMALVETLVYSLLAVAFIPDVKSRLRGLGALIGT